MASVTCPNAAGFRRAARRTERRRAGSCSRSPRPSRPWRATAAGGNRVSVSAMRPRTPRPAATGTASGEQPDQDRERDVQIIGRALRLRARAPWARGSRRRPPPGRSACRRAGPRRPGRSPRSDRVSSASTQSRQHAGEEEGEHAAASRATCGRMTVGVSIADWLREPDDPGLLEHAAHPCQATSREEADEQHQAERGRGSTRTASAGSGRRASRCGCARGRAVRRRGPQDGADGAARSRPARRRRRSSFAEELADQHVDADERRRRAGRGRRRTRGPARQTRCEWAARAERAVMTRRPSCGARCARATFSRKRGEGRPSRAPACGERVPEPSVAG
jgi:hypothetical protein